MSLSLVSFAIPPRSLVHSSRVKKVVTTTLFACLPFTLSACSGGANEVYVPYSLQPAAAASTISEMQKQVEADLFIDGPSTKFQTGDKVPLLLTWTNSSSNSATGVLQARVAAPRGYELVSYSGCDKILANDLVCRFEGRITPDSSVLRKIVYSVTADAPASAKFVLRSTGSVMTVTVQAE